MPVTEGEKRDQAFKRYEEAKERLKKQDLGTFYGSKPRNYDSVEDDIAADAITDRIEQKLGDLAKTRASFSDSNFAIYNRELAKCLSKIQDIEFQGRLSLSMHNCRDIDEEMKEIAKALRYHEHELHLYNIDSYRLNAIHKRSLRAVVNEEVKRLYSRDLPKELILEEQAPAPELGKAIVPARTYLIRSEKGLAYAGLVDYKIELPSKAPMTAKDWTMVDIMTEACLRWIRDPSPDSISFSDDDVWWWTGLKGWHVTQIKAVFLRVVDLKVIAPSKTKYDEITGTWTQTTYYGRVFNADKIVTYGKLLGRKGPNVGNRSIKHQYYFTPDERYARLLINLALGKALRLNKKFSSLHDEAQIINRRFSLFKHDKDGCWFTYKQIAILLGWNSEGTKQMCAYRLKRMKTFLEELKKADLIRWQVKNPKKRGRETVFHLREPEKRLKT